MKRQYIKVFRHFNTLYDIYRDEFGTKHVIKTSDVPCELFIQSKSETEYTDLIDGNYLSRIPCSGFSEYKNTVEKYKDVSSLYGTQKPEDQYRRYTYFGRETFMTPKIVYFDIETAFNGSYLNSDMNIVSGEGGFPKPEQANAPITSIGAYFDGKHVVLGLKEMKEELTYNAKYHKCDDEIDLIETFFKLIKHWNPDILAGWNTNGFDFPFIVNRMKRLEIDLTMIDTMGLIEDDRYMKIAVPKSYYWVDMLDFYKKFVFTPRESYSLQAIGTAELGEGKVEYHEDGDLEQLYNNNFKKFLDYNIKDVQLLVDIDKKVNLLPLACEMAYLYNINLDAVVGTTGPWAQLIYCETRKNNVIIPEKKSSPEIDIEGGFVFTNPGYYEWVVSFDFASLYPSLIRAFNICPSTYIKEKDLSEEMLSIRSRYVNSDTNSGILNQITLTQEQKEEIKDILHRNHCTLSPSGHFFKTDKEGVFPYMMSKIYSERKVAKKKMLAAEKELYESKDLPSIEKDRLKALITKFNNEQMALKIAMNSAYGAFANAHFILAMKQIAESITSGGRLYDRSVKYHFDNELAAKFDYPKEPSPFGDTDSVYVYLEPIVKKSGLTDKLEILEYIDKKVVPILNKIIKEKVLDDLADYRNIRVPEAMDMEREVIADKGIVVGKKNYTLNVLDSEGTRFEKGKKKIVGLNIKKTNIPEFVRNKMLEFLDLLFAGDEIEFQKEFKLFKESFESTDITEISFPRGVNIITDKQKSGAKKLGDNKYEYTLETVGLPIHVRASLVYNKYITEKNLTGKYNIITNGGKIKFVPLKVPNPLMSEVIGYPNDHQHKSFMVNEEILEYVDYSSLFEGVVKAPLKPLLEQLEWNFEKTFKLTDFF